MGVSENRGTAKSSISIGFSIINHSILGYHYFWKHPNIFDADDLFFYNSLPAPLKVIGSKSLVCETIDVRDWVYAWLWLNVL